MTRKHAADLPTLTVVGKSPGSFSMDMTLQIRSTRDPSFLEGLAPERIQRYFFIGRGWRLTGRGDYELSKWFQQYVSRNTSNQLITGKILLNLDAAISSPWRIRDDEIIVYDPNVHFELQMADGNTHTYAEFRRSRV